MTTTTPGPSTRTRCCSTRPGRRPRSWHQEASSGRGSLKDRGRRRKSASASGRGESARDVESGSGAASKTRHLRVGPGLGHEEEAAPIQVALALEQGLERRLHVFPALLRGLPGVLSRDAAAPFGSPVERRRSPRGHLSETRARQIERWARRHDAVSGQEAVNDPGLGRWPVAASSRSAISASVRSGSAANGARTTPLCPSMRWER